MPELLSEMQSDLAANPLIRDIITLKLSTYAYNWPGEHYGYFEDKKPGIFAKVRLLADHNLF